MKANSLLPLFGTFLVEIIIIIINVGWVYNGEGDEKKVGIIKFGKLYFVHA